MLLEGDNINLINFDSKDFPIKSIQAYFEYVFFTDSEQEINATEDIKVLTDDKTIYSKEIILDFTTHFDKSSITFINPPENLDEGLFDGNILFADDLRPIHSLYVSQTDKINEEFDLQFLDTSTKNFDNYLQWYNQNLLSFDSQTRKEIGELDQEISNNKQIISQSQIQLSNNIITDPDAVIRNNILNDVISSKQWHIYSKNPSTSEIDQSLEIQSKQMETDLTGSIIPSLFYPSLFKDEKTVVFIDENYSNPTFVGYYIVKYDIKTDSAPEVELCWDNRFIDTNIKYGRTYKYVVRPIYAVTSTETEKLGEEILTRNEVLCIVGDDSAECIVECIETTKPRPPSNLRFNLLNKKLQIKWDYQESFWPKTSKVQKDMQSQALYIPVGDIKGVQIFYRNSLEEPYMLFKHINFNKGTKPDLRIRVPELIDNEYIVNYEKITDTTPKSFIMSIRANTDYYFALCAIDAHGNSSDYSVQYYVRRNNVTGDLHVKTISFEGAWKQYPNMLLNKEVVKSSFQISNYNKATIYFNPDLKQSEPSIDANYKGELSLHLMELNSGKQKLIKLDLQPKQN